MKFLKLRKYGFIIITFLIFTSGFISGSFAPVNASSSSSVLPITKGGTGSNFASGAAENILGENFANYSGDLPASQLNGTVSIGAGGTGADNISAAQRNLQIPQSYTYDINSYSALDYVRVGMIKIDNSTMGRANQAVIISGLYNLAGTGAIAALEMSGRSNQTRITMLSSGTCDVWIYYYDKDEIRYYYATSKQSYRQTTSVNIIQNNLTNPAFVPDILTTMPENSVEVGQAACRN
ncbi:MAG: hypothetical protein LBT91_02995 [Bifidobacteriaceae bacterium]|jgi:hypothetical protein|nr:hypothetical protein [Bifidobacteriaceae bacterium]